MYLRIGQIYGTLELISSPPCSLWNRYLLQENFHSQPDSPKIPMLATVFNFWDDIWYNFGYLSLRVIPSPTQESSQNRIWSPLPSFQRNWLLTATMLLWWIIDLKSDHQEEKICLGGPSSKPLQPLYFEVSILLHRWSCCWNINHFHLIRRQCCPPSLMKPNQGMVIQNNHEVEGGRWREN